MFRLQVDSDHPHLRILGEPTGKVLADARNRFLRAGHESHHVLTVRGFGDEDIFEFTTPVSNSIRFYAGGHDEGPHRVKHFLHALRVQRAITQVNATKGRIKDPKDRVVCCARYRHFRFVAKPCLGTGNGREPVKIGVFPRSACTSAAFVAS